MKSPRGSLRRRPVPKSSFLPFLGALFLCLPSLPAGPFGSPRWARGDVHLHSGFSSDGNTEFPELWSRIRSMVPAGPRFAYQTEHNDIAGFFPNPTRPPSQDNWRHWGAVREVSRSLSKGQELFLAGQELGGLRGGHVGAIALPQTRGEAPPTIVWKKGYHHAQWMQRVRAAGGLNVVYHPRGVDELGPVHPGTFTHWDSCLPYIDAVSVWNGYKLYDEPDEWAWNRLWRLWRRGFRITAVAGSDSHRLELDEGQKVPFWGIEERLGFHSYPLNPHTRVWVGESLDEDKLRQGIRRGLVTLADRSENWLDFEVRSPGFAPLGIGAEGSQGAPGLKVHCRGYGDPETYSGDPQLELEWAREEPEEANRFCALEPGTARCTPWIDPEDPRLRGPEDEARHRRRVPIPRGDFELEVPLELGPGNWILTARVVPDSSLKKSWRGVQIANPIRIRISSSSEN